MRTFTGIDLGSTTTKAVMLDEDGQILGRGITNSRSNYDLAATIAKAEAHVSARFRLLSRELEKTEPAATLEKFLTLIEVEFRRQQSLEQLRLLADATARECEHPRVARIKDALIERVAALVEHMIQAEAKPAPLMVVKEEKKTSDFFRDRAASQYSRLAETHADARVTFDDLMSIFDKAIIRVENTELKESFQDLMLRALSKVSARFDETTAQRHRTAVQRALDIELLNGGSSGRATGGSACRSPSSTSARRSCATAWAPTTMFPATRTVLDIGGQDTKAIQVDDRGIVTSFQMNDRCAAGCGRYLGYIADEMNLGVHELGPIAMQSERRVKISSHVHGVRRRRAARPPEQRAASRGHPGRPAPRHHPARHVAAGPLGRRAGRVHLHRRRGQQRGGGDGAAPAGGRELRRAHGEHLGGSIYTGALGAALFSLRAAHEQAAA
jgi:benzoyl-CoA reductase subunit A